MAKQLLLMLYATLFIWKRACCEILGTHEKTQHTHMQRYATGIRDL